jgi:hypothetical protein
MMFRHLFQTSPDNPIPLVAWLIAAILVFGFVNLIVAQPPV